MLLFNAETRQSVQKLRARYSFNRHPFDEKVTQPSPTFKSARLDWKEKMRNGLLIVIYSTLLLVAGCATSNVDRDTEGPRIDRISAEELARIIPQPVAKLSLDDLVRLSQAGSNAEQIIAQIQATDSMYDLTPSQSLELSGKGVDARVLDFIHEQRELALRNNLADEINRREKQKQAELAKLKSRLWQQQRYYDPFCRGYYGLTPYGYGGYGSRFGSHFGLGAGVGMPLGCW